MAWWWSISLFTTKAASKGSIRSLSLLEWMESGGDVHAHIPTTPPAYPGKEDSSHRPVALELLVAS